MGRRMSNSRLCQRVESIPKVFNMRLTPQISASTDIDLLQMLVWDLYTNIQNDFRKKMCRKIPPDLHGTLEKNPIRTHKLAPLVWWKYKDMATTSGGVVLLKWHRLSDITFNTDPYIFTTRLLQPTTPKTSTKCTVMLSS